MKITDNRNTGTHNLSTIKIGDTFLYGGDLCMLLGTHNSNISHSGTWAVVRLSGGQVFTTPTCLTVIPVNVEIIIL
jgi:hypothetical protein